MIPSPRPGPIPIGGQEVLPGGVVPQLLADCGEVLTQLPVSLDNPLDNMIRITGFQALEDAVQPAL
nr:hypothetical protein [uncultured Oscillibacter sp.]